MVREKIKSKRVLWSPEEDQKLLASMEEHGDSSWGTLAAKSGLQRCGKSCRNRWNNYLRPNIKRGKFTLEEDEAIMQFHKLLGNRWVAIANLIPNRTDNQIKSHWKYLQKKLIKMRIDLVTYKLKNESVFSSIDDQSKNVANMSHMAQWESTRLEAEARVVPESKLRSHSIQLNINPWDDLESPISTPTSKAVGSSSIPVHDMTMLEHNGGGGYLIINYN